MNKISELLHDKVYSFKSPGVGTVLMHKNALIFFQLTNFNCDKITYNLIKLQVKLKKKL